MCFYLILKQCSCNLSGSLIRLNKEQFKDEKSSRTMHKRTSKHKQQILSSWKWLGTLVNSTMSFDIDCWPFRRKGKICSITSTCDSCFHFWDCLGAAGGAESNAMSNVNRHFYTILNSRKKGSKNRNKAVGVAKQIERHFSAVSSLSWWRQQQQPKMAKWTLYGPQAGRYCSGSASIIRTMF